MEEKKNLTVQTLHAVVDWIVQSSSEDKCQLCAYNREETNLACCLSATERCYAHQRRGDIACREGIIEKVQISLTEGGAQ